MSLFCKMKLGSSAMGAPMPAGRSVDEFMRTMTRQLCLRVEAWRKVKTEGAR